MTQQNRKIEHADIEFSRDYEEVFSQGNIYEVCRHNVFQQGFFLNESTSESDRKEFLTQLAASCYDAGIAEENAITFAQKSYWRWKREVELTVHNYYSEQKQTFAACRNMGKGQRKQFLIDDFLARNYALRFNVMTGDTEYSDLHNYRFGFLPLTDRIRYDMRTRMERENITLWDSDLKQRLTSSAIRDFYPMEDFLFRLPKWDKRPRIEKLAKTIPTDNENWPQLFHRWFISMVSHWLRQDYRYANSLIPVLVGPQGCGKSQWIRSLLPVELTKYYHDGFDFRNSTTAQEMMRRYALINIDEFDSLTAKQEPYLKNLIQLTDVHINGQPERRFCSFIATSNHRELHRDTSGSRRYIFVDIKGDIHLNHRLSLLQIYAEAVYEIQNDERTYLTKAEEKLMQETNEEFREQDVTEQLFLQYYEPLQTREQVEGGEWLMAIEIFQNLERISKKDFGIKRANKFGAILRKYCGKAGSKRGVTSQLYHVRLKVKP